MESLVGTGEEGTGGVVTVHVPIKVEMLNHYIHSNRPYLVH
jgi:hypothetical protein